MVIDVKDMVRQEKQELKQCELFRQLLIIQVGNDEASNRYIRGKVKDCEELGWRAYIAHFDEGVEPIMITRYIQQNRFDFDGIIIQEPAKVNGTLAGAIDMIPDKADVDGFKRTSLHPQATPAGIMKILEYLNVDLEGKVVTVVGRGKLVGGPLVPMLMQKRATVISCNSKTRELEKFTSCADIVVSATGQKCLIKRNMLRDSAIVIDAGITFDENGRMCGDCDKAIYDDPNILITSVPGGVGLMTRVMLLNNLANT